MNNKNVREIGTPEDMSSIDIVIKSLNDSTIMTNFIFKEGVEELQLCNEDHVIGFEILKFDADKEEHALCLNLSQTLLLNKSSYLIADLTTTLLVELSKSPEVNITGTYFSVITVDGIINVYLNSLMVEKNNTMISGLLEYLKAVINKGIISETTLEWISIVAKEKLEPNHYSTISDFIRTDTLIKKPEETSETDDMLPSNFNAEIKER